MADGNERPGMRESTWYARTARRARWPHGRSGLGASSAVRSRACDRDRAPGAPPPCILRRPPRSPRGGTAGPRRTTRSTALRDEARRPHGCDGRAPRRPRRRRAGRCAGARLRGDVPTDQVHPERARGHRGRVVRAVERECWSASARQLDTRGELAEACALSSGSATGRSIRSTTSTRRVPEVTQRYLDLSLRRSERRARARASGVPVVEALVVHREGHRRHRLTQLEPAPVVGVARVGP